MLNTIKCYYLSYLNLKRNNKYQSLENNENFMTCMCKCVYNRCGYSMTLSVLQITQSIAKLITHIADPHYFHLRQLKLCYFDMICKMQSMRFYIYVYNNSITHKQLWFHGIEITTTIFQTAISCNSTNYFANMYHIHFGITYYL